MRYPKEVNVSMTKEELAELVELTEGLHIKYARQNSKQSKTSNLFSAIEKLKKASLLEHKDGECDATRSV